MNLALVLCPRTGGRYFLLASILTILASAHFGAMADVAWPEQVMFAMEGVRVSRPIDLPDNALRVMRKNTTVLSCLEQGKSPDDIPGTWFVASEIHLRTSNQFNLVVMPRQTSESPSANRCLFHAHSIPFWILIKRGTGYTIVLEANVQVLRVLRTTSHEYRNIETTSSNLNEDTKWLYQFDGHKYALKKKTSTPWR